MNTDTNYKNPTFGLRCVKNVSEVVFPVCDFKIEGGIRYLDNFDFISLKQICTKLLIFSLINKVQICKTPLWKSQY